jgi:hypothetical protein
VKIEGGCATVTGYKLSIATVSITDGKAKARFETSSQDTGLAVLVVIGLAANRLLRQREG